VGPYFTTNVCFWRAVVFFTESPALVMMASACSGLASASDCTRALRACRAPMKTTRAALRAGMEPFTRVCAVVSAALYLVRAPMNATTLGSVAGRFGLLVTAACTASPYLSSSAMCVGRLRAARMR
jgi:hypothetical protein